VKRDSICLSSLPLLLRFLFAFSGIVVGTKGLVEFVYQIFCKFDADKDSYWDHAHNWKAPN
jgi:hypothetical protein